MRANLCRVQNGQNGFPLHSRCVQLNCSPRTASNNKEIYDMKWTLQPLTQARIQASEKGMAPTNFPPRLRISQDPKQSSLQSQVKRCTKTTRLQRHLPLSILNSAVPPLKFANILLYLLQPTSTHRALHS